VAAIADRLTFNAHIIETGTKSYRLRTTTAPGSLRQLGPNLVSAVGPIWLDISSAMGA